MTYKIKTRTGSAFTEDKDIDNIINLLDALGIKFESMKIKESD